MVLFSVKYRLKLKSREKKLVLFMSFPVVPQCAALAAFDEINIPILCTLGSDLRRRFRWQQAPDWFLFLISRNNNQTCWCQVLKCRIQPSIKLMKQFSTVIPVALMAVSEWMNGIYVEYTFPTELTEVTVCECVHAHPHTPASYLKTTEGNPITI